MNTKKYLMNRLIIYIFEAIIVIIIIYFKTKSNNTIYENKIGMTVNFPSTWIAGTPKYTNSDKTCSVEVNSSKRDLDRIKEELLPYKIEYSQKKKDKVDMYYGYIETETEKIYTYIFAHPNVQEKRYLIYRQDKYTSTQDCYEFINNIEERIIINY